ncbi:unnamed protein product [Effrenium voratum]|uniref:Uncharacterized protein n=1 Tax=Effrenium voratum TaxID=2562239 RepID=A0AA36MUU6_9DINO|nr:unnamed protein product [Effrenium voratum]
MELSMATRGRQKKPTDRSTSAVDGRRLLRAVLPQGGCQVVLKGTAEDQMGLQPAAGPAITAAAAAASRREGKEGTPPVMIVSGEAFAALAIGQGLLLPPDPLQYGGQDDEDLVKEVAQEVQVLAEEYGMLLDLYRGLRQDLKRTLRLVPDYNTDELRGTLKSVMVLDNEERVLVPAPVLETEFIGLGDGSNVPPYLRFVGSVSIKPFREEAVTGLCQELWVEKTTHVLLEEDSGRPQLALDMFVNDKFLPARANGRAQQMEVMYNFLLALRDRTTLKQLSEGAHEALGISSVAKPGRRRSNLGRRRSSLNRRPSCQDLGNLGRKMAETCPSCGNVFAADALFCRMCRTKRPGAEDETDQEVCRCGNVFLADAVFCRRCGAERPKSEAALVKSRTQDLLLEEFNPFAELLYRGLLRDLHEDTFHDASTMLLNLCCCLVCLQHRFVSSASRVVGEDEERPLEMNVSVLSAVLRLFFPRKPREHLTALKTILQPTAQLHAVRTRDRLKKERVQFQEETFFTQKHALHKPDAPLPPSISLKEMFCLPAVDGCKMQGGHKQLLDNLLRYPSSFVQELRRQHLLECILSAEKLQRALRVNRKHHAGKDEETAHQLTAKEILEALGKADRDLSLDQRHIYLLRGFGRRLPDMPSTAEDLGEAYVAAGRAQKVRKMLQDYSNELVESGATVVLQDFMQNLHNSGVVKGGKHWEPEITLQNVAEESGITSMLVTAPGRAVLEELTSAHIASGTAREEEGVTRTEPEARAPESPEPFETYRWLAELGHNVQELSLGYSAMYLSYWVNNSL